jgi:hypothetical protein
MADLREQELSLLTCIMAIIQKEGLSDSRNRQAAENDRRQNEDQIWQRASKPVFGALCALRRPARLLGYLASPRLLAASAACFGVPLARDHLALPVYPSCMYWCWCAYSATRGTSYWLLATGGRGHPAPIHRAQRPRSPQGRSAQHTTTTTPETETH